MTSSYTQRDTLSATNTAYRVTCMDNDDEFGVLYMRKCTGGSHGHMEEVLASHSVLCTQLQPKGLNHNWEGT